MTEEGIQWQITLKVECVQCGEKHYDHANGRTEITMPFKFVPFDADLDELRTEFLMTLQLSGWEVQDLDCWDAYGKWHCPVCVQKEAEGYAEVPSI